MKSPSTRPSATSFLLVVRSACFNRKLRLSLANWLPCQTPVLLNTRDDESNSERVRNEPSSEVVLLMSIIMRSAPSVARTTKGESPNRATVNSSASVPSRSSDNSLRARRMPLVFGPAKISKVPPLYEAFMADGCSTTRSNRFTEAFKPSETVKTKGPLIPVLPGTKNTLSGCDKNCEIF